MDTMQALRMAADRSGRSQRTISEAAGKQASFLSMTFSRGSTLRVDTYAAIAHACGYDLCLVPRDGGDVIMIDGRPDTDTGR